MLIKPFFIFILAILSFILFLNITPGYFQPNDKSGCSCGFTYKFNQSTCKADPQYFKECEHTKFWDSALSFVNKFDLNK